MVAAANELKKMVKHLDGHKLREFCGEKCIKWIFTTPAAPHCNAPNRNVAVGDIVTEADQNTVRGNWAVGRIMTVYPGADRRIRNVTVKTATGEYSCPVTKIAVIHLLKATIK